MNRDNLSKLFLYIKACDAWQRFFEKTNNEIEIFNLYNPVFNITWYLHYIYIYIYIATSLTMWKKLEVISRNIFPCLSIVHATYTR